MSGIDIIMAILFIILWIIFGFLTSLIVTGIISIIVYGVFNLGG